jgi:hypothetical protein
MKRLYFAMIAAFLMLAVPRATLAADRGPSTAEERQQALQYIDDFVANPQGTHAVEERTWTLKWIIEVPDIHVHICMILDKLPKGDKKDSDLVFAGMVLSQTAFAIRNVDKPADSAAEYRAGVEGALRVYENLVKATAKDRQPYLDDLLQRRESGTLAQFVEERASASCGN